MQKSPSVDDFIECTIFAKNVCTYLIGETCWNWVRNSCFALQRMPVRIGYRLSLNSNYIYFHYFLTAIRIWTLLCLISAFIILSIHLRFINSFNKGQCKFKQCGQAKKLEKSLWYVANSSTESRIGPVTFRKRMTSFPSFLTFFFGKQELQYIYDTSKYLSHAQKRKTITTIHLFTMSSKPRTTDNSTTPRKLFRFASKQVQNILIN